MAEIINFSDLSNDSKKVSDLEEKLAKKEKEILELKNEAATIRSVNEMLKLQLAEMRCVINEQIKNLELIKANIESLENKLPTI